MTQSPQSLPNGSAAQPARVINFEADRPPPLECPSPWSLLEAGASVPCGSAAPPARQKKIMKASVKWLSQPLSKRNRTDCNSRSLAVTYISCAAPGLECKTNRVCHEVLKAIEAGVCRVLLWKLYQEGLFVGGNWEEDNG